MQLRLKASTRAGTPRLVATSLLSNPQLSASTHATANTQPSLLHSTRHSIRSSTAVSAFGMRPADVEAPGPGQESVWDYPRPPRLERTDSHIVAELKGQVLFDTKSAYRVLETSHPPVYYIPPEDINMEMLKRTPSRSTYCEWKGRASYYDAPGKPAIAWTYREPTPSFKPITNYLAFYPSKLDKATVNGETVRAQPGDFYGGWITSSVVGPFKGDPGTRMW
jgi:uncharacterized protein (DUF427 family)